MNAVRAERGTDYGTSACSGPSSDMSSASVVIASRDRPDDLARLLGSIRAQTLQPREVIVVDDGSSPALPRLNGTWQIRSERSEGACRARNRGIATATGKYVFIFDDDAELRDPRLLERAVRAADSMPRLGALAIRQLQPDGHVHWMQPGSGEEMRLVPSFLGYGALLVREAVQAVGGFFEPLGYYYEENELSLRLIDGHFEVAYDPQIGVIHHQNAAGRSERLIHRLCWRNNMAVVVARYPAYIVPLELLRVTVRWIRLAQQWRHFMASDLGWGWASLMRQLPELLRRRDVVRMQTLLLVRHLARTLTTPTRIL